MRYTFLFIFCISSLIADAAPKKEATYIGDGTKKPIKTRSGHKVRYKGHLKPDSVARKASFHGAILYEGRLDGVNFADASLSGADLQYASLEGANLRKADLSEANLYGADLTDAQLPNADVTDADFRKASLAGADFEGAKITGAILYKAEGWDKANWKGAYYLNTDPPIWPPGMDPQRFGIKEIQAAKPGEFVPLRRAGRDPLPGQNFQPLQRVGGN